MTEENTATEAKAKPAKAKAKPAAKKAAAKKPAAKKAAKAKPAKEAKGKAPREGSVEQNGITRPRDGGASSAIWSIADAISKRTRKPATRADVLVEAEKQSLNPATVATQFARWRQFNGISGRAEA